ncbi:hypothetical protein [Pseudogracilibacillus sp. SO30301A]|uniref:hypothetical protein n=1 Tax=Pseudogracilibacillus sp. SO30301A TaxID=3098291 RepID=UPI00300E0105
MQMDCDLIHSTDLSFHKFIYQEFGINRGVYNTIDQWFFDQGCINVIHRRTEIIHFLHFASRAFEKSENKLVFGSGRLVTYLVKYSERNRSNDYIEQPMNIQTKTG